MLGGLEDSVLFPRAESAYLMPVDWLFNKGLALEEGRKAREFKQVYLCLSWPWLDGRVQRMEDR